jgi:phage tail sheath protein FI
MPVTPTYPGVYIQEVDSGSRVVTGVATSITAFVGRTIKGPANTPITCFNYGDFERMFGGLAIDMPVPYAVQDFFENGGSQALIARVCAGPPLEAAASLVLPGTDPAFKLTARVKGEIGNQLYLNIAYHGGSASTNADVPSTYDVSLTLGQPAAAAPASSSSGASSTSSASSGTAGAVSSSSAATTPARPAWPITLATSNPNPDDPGLTPSAIGMWLGGLNNLVGVSGSIDPDAATTIINDLASKKTVLKFGGGQDGTGATAPKFVAGDLTIQSKIKGSWADTLELSISTNGDDTIDGNYVLTANHPILAEPYSIGFWDWPDLQTKLGPTPLTSNVPAKIQTPLFSSAKRTRALTTGASSTSSSSDSAGAVAASSTSSDGLSSTSSAGGVTPAAVPAKPKVAFAGSSISLVRMPDGQGASAAMLPLGLGLILTASSPGEWGNKYGVYWDKKNITNDVALRFADYGISGTDDFWNVNVVETSNGPKASWPTVETIGPVYIGPLDAPCRIDHVLATQSGYLRAFPPLMSTPASALLQDPTQIKSPGKVDGVAVLRGMLTTGQDGETLTTDIVLGSETGRTGIYSFDNADLFNIMVIPPDSLLGGDTDMKVIYGAASKYCSDHRAILIADPLDAWGFKAKRSQFGQIQPTDFNIDGIVQRRSIFTYFPRIKKSDPLRANREMVFSASGMIAGIFAATDVRRGVWKAPAGVEAGMNGVTALEYKLTDMQNGQLNQVGINVLRDFPVVGKVIWGSRTLAGADAMSDDYKYLPARRLTNYIEESLLRATKYAVFEPNAEPLWATMRLSIGAFMSDLARQGAFYDYYVRCDASTTTSNDINLGKCNAIIAFAPVKPAEFIILTIQQLALKPAA